MTAIFTADFTAALDLVTLWLDTASPQVWSSSGGQLLSSTSSFRVLQTTSAAHAPIADVGMSFTRRSATFDGGLVCRCTTGGTTSATGNCYVINPFGTQVDVIRRIAGVNTSLPGGLTGLTYANGDVFKVIVQTFGATVTFDCYINGVLVGTVTDSSGLRLLNTGSTGFVVFNSACRFDDFIVDDLAVSGSGLVVPRTNLTLAAVNRAANF